MPVFELRVRCEVENVSSLIADASFAWRVRVRCTNCGEDSPHPLVLYATDSVKLTRGGEASAQYKCKLCGRQNDISLVKDEAQSEYVVTTVDDDDDDSGASGRRKNNKKDTDGWRPFAKFECRGMQPTAWEFDEDLIVVAGSGFRFEDATFEDNDFYGYDEVGKQESSVTELESEFRKL
mmetsp:Transcript_5119/g.10836  ORF Transcript_5119/g.10836 Transcript_5119/m.10836 type:complete len:179 (+) Transcript_5119:26-562(+)